MDLAKPLISSFTLLVEYKCHMESDSPRGTRRQSGITSLFISKEESKTWAKNFKIVEKHNFCLLCQPESTKNLIFYDKICFFYLVCSLWSRFRTIILIYNQILRGELFHSVFFSLGGFPYTILIFLTIDSELNFPFNISSNTKFCNCSCKELFVKG